jgi:putative ABC transport system substrate-binding protein
VFAAWILVGLPAAEAQPATKVHRVAFLGSTSPAGYATQLAAFRGGLRELGYVEGQNLLIDFRWGHGEYDRLPRLAAELVRLKPEVLVTHGVPGALAAKRATSTIPIVIGVVGEAVAIGAADALARPGGNVTGSSFFVPELNAKRLEILKEGFPRLERVGVLVNRNNAVNVLVLKAMERTAQTLKLQLHPVEVQQPGDIENGVASFVKAQVGAFVVEDDAFLFAQSTRIAEAARKHQLPTIGFVDYGRAGGLLAFGVSFPDLWRRAASFVEKILKGAKPADLPIEQPTKFELIVNVKTANAIRVTLPPALMYRADQIIE